MHGKSETSALNENKVGGSATYKKIGDIAVESCVFHVAWAGSAHAFPLGSHVFVHYLKKKDCSTSLMEKYFTEGGLNQNNQPE